MIDKPGTVALLWKIGVIMVLHGGVSKSIAAVKISDFSLDFLTSRKGDKD